jgi:hypothetical protein
MLLSDLSLQMTSFLERKNEGAVLKDDNKPPNDLSSRGLIKTTSEGKLEQGQCDHETMILSVLSPDDIRNKGDLLKSDKKPLKQR